jgi:hypothetical protein
MPPHPVTDGGNLANSGSQISLASGVRFFFDDSLLLESFSGHGHPQPLSSKLSDLKRKAFSESGRKERIARSLAAVNAPQPTKLSSFEWKRIAEADIEDQY